MVTEQEGKKVRRIFTAEQKFEILKDIERAKTIKEGLAKHELAQSVYHKWKRQLAVGVRASLRNRTYQRAHLRVEAQLTGGYASSSMSGTSKELWRRMLQLSR